MWCKFKRSFLVLLIAILALAVFSTSSALASIRSTTEAPGQVLVQSRHTLRDFDGNSWQVVLFKRVNPDNSSSVSLRLVGFPGNVEFDHPQPLIITTSLGKIQSAADMFAEQAPGSNVGQYEFTEVINQIGQNGSLRVSLPVKNQPLELKVPSVVVLEWQTVNNG